MKIYLMRHGETPWNVQARLQGHSDIELNEKGIELAQKTSEALSEVAFDLIISSPLKRALETARIMKRERQIPILIEERIKEIGFGTYEGLCCDEENYNIPEKDFIKKFFEYPETYHVPEGGESLEDLSKRTGEFMNEVIHNPDYQNKTILITAHGAAIRGILNFINQNKISEFWGSGVHKNCAVTLLSVEDGQPKVVTEGKVYY